MVQPLFTPEDCSDILKLASNLGALKFNDLTLSSGQKSSYYFDGRLLSLDSEGANLLAEILVQLTVDLHVDAVGGPTIGADPIVGATLALAKAQACVLKGFLVRSEPKGHGTQKQVEGPLEPGMRVIVLDDTCSTGGSLIRSIEAVEGMDCKVALVFTVLDRHQGGSDELRRRGYRYVTLLEADAQGNIVVAQ